MPDSHPTPLDTNSLWDKNEAASFLRRSVTTLDRGVREGKIPHYRIGSRVWFDPADLRSLVASGYRPVSKD